MDNDTVTLTSELRAQMEDALLADINNRDSRTRVGSMTYLGTLLNTSNDTVLAADHPLIDVIEYFGLDDDET